MLRVIISGGPIPCPFQIVYKSTIFVIRRKQINKIFLFKDVFITSLKYSFSSVTFLIFNFLFDLKRLILIEFVLTHLKYAYFSSTKTAVP